MTKYEYPVCRKSDLVEDHFGYKLPCPYTWLRNTNDPEVLDFTRRENEFTDAWFNKDEVNQKITDLKNERFDSLPNSISPWKDGYIATEEKEGNYFIVSLDASFNKTETLFKRYDLPKYTPFSASACPVDENLLGIMAQVDAAPRPDYLAYDVKTGKILATLPLTFSGTWSKTKRYLYAACTEVKENDSITSILRYNADTDSIETIFTYPKYSIFGNVTAASDNKTLIFTFCKDYSNDYYYSYNEETGAITPINADNALEISYLNTIADKHYFITHVNTVHGILLSVEDGKDFTSAKQVKEETDYFLESGFSYNDKLYVLETKDACSYLYCVDDDKFIDLPDPVANLSLSGEGKDFKIFSIDSFTNRPQLLKFDGNSLSPLTKGQEVNPDLVVDLKWATSNDGTDIPYYFVHLKDTKCDGTNPTMMYGYGGYNNAMPPQSVERVSQTNIRHWVENGGIYIHTLLRGGNEYGPKWHEGGMLMNKKNCYADFIAIAEKVIKENWTSPEHLVITGCSNGGLLMSTLVTMRPDLWGCVIDSVPHTDMIHFVEDDRGAMYITEYGDPRASKEWFEYFLSYSPVHNVKKTNYPPVYIQTGECDNNVPPYHGKSFAATMQENNTSDNPILLRVLKLGSHDRGQGEVFWKTIAEMHVFIDKALKIDF